MNQLTRDELIAQIRAQTSNDPPLNLQGADLRDANLWGADLRRADLRRANLREAHLREANLWEADLRRANLRRANLIESDLRRANLRRANLWEANLRRANLRRADLREADLWEADLRGANLRRADLRRTDLFNAVLDDVIMNWNSRVLISEGLQQAANEPLQYALAGWILIGDFEMCWEYYFRETDNDIWRETREWAIALMKTWVKPGDGAPAILKENNHEDHHIAE